ncbi:elongation of very long chain fatty acids protein 4-like [Biomphalaria glabrata]|uniref:Elongation of very long chain fatty acids protein n=1 Tax=Biomphalaria glabrata TaxID=6526 RepID=A0A9W3AC78_BIOGL|nr:elongation of very long chain fatty acids protein 4-like [Biomphalaria glabrata]
MWWKLEEMKRLYDQVMDLRDRKFDGYPLFDSPLVSLLILTLYISFVWYGTKWMETRKPLKLKEIMFVYNCFMVLFLIYQFVWGMFAFYYFGISFVCTNWINYDFPEDFRYRLFPQTPPNKRLYSSQTTPNKRLVSFQGLAAAASFYYSKLLELMDTIFLVLRKKFNQLSFLHVYHHAMTVIFVWLGYKFVPGGPVLIFPILNGSVHILMYSYYALAAIGIRLTRLKRYLTIIQILQQCFLIVLVVVNMFHDCPFMWNLGLLAIIYVISLLILFSNFYIKSYVTSDRHKAQLKEKTK